MARLLYIGCFSLADDDGRIHGEAEFLKGAIFRYQRLSFDAIRKLRDELETACSNFIVYQAHGNTYIAFTNWGDFQKPKYPKPSKLPPPPKTRKHRKGASTQAKSSGKGSGKPSEAFREDSPIGKGRDGLGLSTTGGCKPKGVAAARTIESLPLNIAYEVMQIVKRTHGADEGSTEVLAKIAKGMPQATVADVRSRCTGKHIGWAVKALKGELEERVA
jgi:hypothetical protein